MIARNEAPTLKGPIGANIEARSDYADARSLIDLRTDVVRLPGRWVARAEPPIDSKSLGLRGLGSRLHSVYTKKPALGGLC